MQDLTTVSDTAAGRTPHWLISMFIMLIILVANGAVIIGLLQMLTWSECVLLVVAGSALSCGLLYTVVTMSRLGKSE